MMMPSLENLLPAGRELGRTLRDLVFPPNCLTCEELVEESEFRHVCRRCAPLVVRVHEPHCSTCGHPFYGEIDGERICPHCEGLRPAYDRAKTLTLFKGPAREWVLALKYRQGFFVLEDMKQLLLGQDAVLEFLRDSVLVPVPLHPRKERERGYNQSQLIAECFANAVGEGTSVQNLLVRTRDTASQTTLDRRTRQTRMKNAFAAQKQAAITPDHRYVLVDDVFTTGSTLNAAANALRKGGAVKIDVITFAHG